MSNLRLQQRAFPFLCPVLYSRRVNAVADTRPRAVVAIIIPFRRRCPFIPAFCARGAFNYRGGAHLRLTSCIALVGERKTSLMNCTGSSCLLCGTGLPYGPGLNSLKQRGRGILPIGEDKGKYEVTWHHQGGLYKERLAGAILRLCAYGAVYTTISSDVFVKKERYKNVSSFLYRGSHIRYWEVA